MIITEVVIFVILLLETYSQTIQLQSPRLTNFGTWHDWAKCPEGKYANGIRIKFEGDQRGGDDTALNAVSLYCQDLDGGFKQDSWIMSGEGLFGEWQGIKFCPVGTLIVGFALRSEKDQRGKDDVAADNFCGYCGTVNGPRDNTLKYVQGDTAGWGDWTADQFCPQGYVVCAIQSQIEGDQKGGDDTALNNVNLECCFIMDNCVPNATLALVRDFDNSKGAGTVEFTYEIKVSYSRTSQRTTTTTQSEKEIILEKFSNTSGLEAVTDQVNNEILSNKEHLKSTTLQEMIQEAITRERTTIEKYTVPAMSRVIIEQLVITCGQHRMGLMKTVIRS